MAKLAEDWLTQSSSDGWA